MVAPPVSNVFPNSNASLRVAANVFPSAAKDVSTVQRVHIASAASVPPWVQPPFPKSPPKSTTVIVPYTVTSNGSSPESVMLSSLDTSNGNRPQPQLSFMQQVLHVIAPRDVEDGGIEDMDVDNLKRKREKHQRKKTKAARSSTLVHRPYNTRSSAKFADVVDSIAFEHPKEEIDAVDLNE